MNYKTILNKKQTGLKIYKEIEKSGFTYEKIAEELRLRSPRVIYEWVNGRKMPSLIRLVNLSVLLNVHIEDLLHLE